MFLCVCAFILLVSSLFLGFWNDLAYLRRGVCYIIKLIRLKFEDESSGSFPGQDFLLNSKILRSWKTFSEC